MNKKITPWHIEYFFGFGLGILPGLIPAAYAMKKLVPSWPCGYRLLLFLSIVGSFGAMCGVASRRWHYPARLFKNVNRQDSRPVNERTLLSQDYTDDTNGGNYGAVSAQVSNPL